MQLINIIVKKEYGNNINVYIDNETYNIGKTHDEWHDMHHKGRTATVRHEARDWNLVIGSAGGRLTHKYYVEINGVRNDELEFASKAKVNLPDIIRSETLPIYSDTIRREAFSFFAKVLDPNDREEKHMKQWVTVEHSAKNESIDVVFNKSCENLTGISFDDDSSFPILV